MHVLFLYVACTFNIATLLYGSKRNIITSTQLYRKKTQSPIEMNTISCDDITANQAYDALSHKFYDDIDDISVVYEEISTA